MCITMDRKEAVEIVRSNFPNGRIQLSDALKTLIPELQESEDEQHRKWILEYLYDGMRKSDEYFKNQFECAIAWLEKQKQEQPKVSIWKHWKGGLAGNGEGKQIYLIKDGDIYSISSCLGFECDYIELSELDNLMIETQGEQKSVEWSEEDKGFIDLLLAIFTNEHPNGLFTTGDIAVFNGNSVPSSRIVTWLKSLKHQNTWKPTEEQMQTLHSKRIEGSVIFPVDAKVLSSLYEDLLKL